MAHIGRGKLRKFIDSLIVEANISRSWTPFHSRSRGNYFRGWVNDNVSQDEIESAFEGFPDNTLDRSGSHTNAYIRQAWRIFGEDFLDDVAVEREAARNPRTGRRPWPFPDANTPEGRDAIEYYRGLSVQNKSILGSMAYTFLSVLERLSSDLVRGREVAGGSVYPTDMLVVPSDFGFGGRHHQNALPGVYSYFSYLDGETRTIGKYWIVYGSWRPGDQLRFYLYNASTNGDGSQFISDAETRPITSFQANRISDSSISRRLADAIIQNMGIDDDEDEEDDSMNDAARDLASVDP